VRQIGWCVVVAGANLLAGLILTQGAWAQPALPPQPAGEPKRPWGPEQALGAPDTPEGGDRQTAWASQTPDGAEEWLRLEYDKPVNVAQVRVRETYNPGAVCKVTAFSANGEEVLLWEGQDPTTEAPDDFVVEVAGNVFSKSVKLYLDSPRVPGWNEIDAVELVGKDGSRQWATGATASSTYAARAAFRGDILWDRGLIAPEPVVRDPFARALTKTVTIHLDGQVVVRGTLIGMGEDTLLVLDAENRRMIAVNRAKIVFAEWPAEVAQPAATPGGAPAGAARPGPGEAGGELGDVDFQGGQ